ncbi:MAG: hypothetical protein ACAH80_17290 [Alphaproteobacteria bacterium]
MRKLIFAAILSAFISVPALAAEEKPVPEIDPALCSRIVEYQKPAGVDYKPGVDANGKPVVEADLNPSPVKMSENISFNITIDVAQYLGLSTPGLEGIVNVGTISVQNGKMTFNGEPMEGHAAKALRELCAKKPEITPEKPVEIAPEPAPDIHIQ